ncbi:MAG: glycosyltransferase [Sedimentisphaerales bacterium]|nr:glycosyltransferase [Sedimentisphaerales bacterium]
MSKTCKILAVVVTYNRLALLKRCIQSLKSQTRQPDEILVINNSSTDGTLEYLKKNDHISHITQKNSGSAGGWHTGIDTAIKNNYDFVWLMDDDGFADINELKNLEDAMKPGMAMLSSLLVDENNINNLVFGLPTLNKKGYPRIIALKRKIKTVSAVLRLKDCQYYPYAHLFNGALLDTAVARKIGNVDRDYFMYGDELDYLWRLKRVGDVCTLDSALHYHPDVSKRALGAERLYYFIRNTIIINNKYLDYKALRNFCTVVIGIYRLLRSNKIIPALKTLFNIRNNYVIRAIKDGYVQRRGKI